MSTNLAVFALGSLISLLVFSGLMIFYAAAYATEASREGVTLSPRWQRVLRAVGLDDDPADVARDAELLSRARATRD